MPSGFVGIGTSAPAFPLDIVGDVNISDGSAYYLGTRLMVTGDDFNLTVGPGGVVSSANRAFYNTIVGVGAGIVLNADVYKNTFVGRSMDEFLGSTKRSAHEVGLLDLMDIARLTEHLPENRALIGIRPDKMGWGMQPTTSVQNALDEAVNEAVKLITQWQKVNTDQEVSAA